MQTVREDEGSAKQEEEMEDTPLTELQRHGATMNTIIALSKTADGRSRLAEVAQKLTDFKDAEAAYQDAEAAYHASQQKSDDLTTDLERANKQANELIEQ